MTLHRPGALDPALYREIVRRSLAEDLGWGDVTTDSTVGPDARALATLVAGEPCVIAGLAVADETFYQLDPAVRTIEHRQDGDWCTSGMSIASWEGRAAPLLTAGRTALNFLERLSGIATATRLVAEASQGRARIVTTRSTTPTLRVLEHYAVEVGGGTKHRGSLDGAVVIRHPHVRMAGGVGAALARVAHLSHELTIEVEVRGADEIDEAAAGGATRVLVAHPDPGLLEAVLAAARGRIQVHVSGDYTREEVSALAARGVDVISAIGVTRRAAWVDLRIDLEPLP